MTAQIHPRFPDYEIHPDGRIFRIRPSNVGGAGIKGIVGTQIRGRILKESGYRQFKLIDSSGKKVFIRANRLMAETFRGPAPSTSHQAAHNDGDRLNNRKDNIRWATPIENAADRFLHGTAKRAHNLTADEIAEIRSQFSGKIGEITELAGRLGISYSATRRIIHGDCR